MFITLLEKVQSAVTVSRYADQKSFMDDFTDLYDQYIRYVGALDIKLAWHLTYNVFQDENANADNQLKRKMQYIVEDIKSGDNHYFKLSSAANPEQVLKNPSKVVFYNYLKKFIERVSCGLVNIDVSKIIIDALLTKRYCHKNDKLLIQAVAVMTVLLRDHGIMEAESVMGILKCFEKHAANEIHEFEFYKYFKTMILEQNEEDWDQALMEPNPDEE